MGSIRNTLPILIFAVLILSPALRLCAEEVEMPNLHPSPGGKYRELLTTDQTMLATSGSAVGIGTSDPAPCALLDLTSTTGGLLLPRMAADPSGTAGLIIYNNNVLINAFEYHDGTNWHPITSVAGGGADLWTLLGTSIYNSNTTGNVGIGTGATVPEARLTVNGGVMFCGTAGTTPTSEAGTRFMWVASKGAFRAGSVTGSQWDDANIGARTFVVGGNSIVSRPDSIALGYGHNITDPTASTSSLAIGRDNTVKSNEAVALGSDITLEGGFLGIGRYIYCTNGGIVLGTGVSAASRLSNGSNGYVRPTAIGFNSTSPILFVASTTANPAVDRVGINTNSPQYELDVNGTLHATGQYIPSDMRLKDSVVPLGSVMDKLIRVRAVRFKWRKTPEFKDLNIPEGEHDIGVVAQEVEKVFPELVSTGGDGVKSVDYGRLSVLLLAGIKELETQNVDLKHRIELLKGKLSSAP